jgi:glycine cleavage system H protein
VIPDDLRYTADHEWVAGGEGANVRVGITHFAQDALGDIVYVQLPETGAVMTAGDPFGEIESTKSVSELYAPVTGTVVERNDALDAAPELVNSDPYGDGWMMTIRVGDGAEAGGDDGLLDATTYQASLDG